MSDIKVPKDYRRYVNAARAQGWTVLVGRRGHAKLRSPSGYATPIPSSSGAPGLLKAFVLRLADNGVVIDIDRVSRDRAVSGDDSKAATFQRRTTGSPS